MNKNTGLARYYIYSFGRMLFEHDPISNKMYVVESRIDEAKDIIAMFESNFSRMAGFQYDERKIVHFPEMQCVSKNGKPYTRKAEDRSVIVPNTHLITVSLSNDDWRFIEVERTTEKGETIKEQIKHGDIIRKQDLFLKHIICEGFYFQGRHYKFFTASAGKIRKGQIFFMEEERLKELMPILLCGLTEEKVSKMQVNPAKYITYNGLCTTATEPFKNFDIDRAIVVPDFIRKITAKVDFIDTETFNIDEGVERDDIEIIVTDGCGMMLRSLHNKTCQFRAPWIKGVLTPFPFDEFIKYANKRERENGSGKSYGIVKDIWGKEWDIIKDRIQVIFTESQFKMAKYYDSWEAYKEAYKRYGYIAGKSNDEPSEIPYARTGYQMLQVLTDATDEELLKVAQSSLDLLRTFHTDRRKMLKIMGVLENSDDERLSPFQKCLKEYPELLSDPYIKERIKGAVRSELEKCRGGRLWVKGKYTFILPDLYAFSEWLFMGVQEPKGLLGRGEVYCRLFCNSKKLDIVRFPVLYRDHCIRTNKVREHMKQWFTTSGLYIATDDIISKALQADYDGDKALVIDDPNIVSLAEKNMKGVCPLLYNMEKGDKTEINPEKYYTCLLAGIRASNVGVFSDHITRLLSMDKFDWKIIKWLCLLNNFATDAAKTITVHKPPKSVRSEIFMSTVIDQEKRVYKRGKNAGKEYTVYHHKPMPYFIRFAQATDKYRKVDIEETDESGNTLTKTEWEKYRGCRKEKVEDRPGNGTVDRLCKLFDDIDVEHFTTKASNVGTIDYKMLMCNPRYTGENKALINLYNELARGYKSRFNWKMDSDKKEYAEVTGDILRKLANAAGSAEKALDTIILYLFHRNKNKKNKRMFYDVFSPMILENLQYNVTGRQCDKCGKRFNPSVQGQRKCPRC